MDFAGGAALQAVSERPLRRYAGIFPVFSPIILIEDTEHTSLLTVRKILLDCF